MTSAKKELSVFVSDDTVATSPHVEEVIVELSTSELAAATGGALDANPYG